MKERKEGLVSVVIPCYNAAQFIEDCLDGLKCQKHDKIEVIIVNDASTDNTLDVVEKWLENSNPHFQTIICNLPVNTGFAGALTVGCVEVHQEDVARAVSGRCDLDGRVDVVRGWIVERNAATDQRERL